MATDFLQTLETVIASRHAADTNDSYTARLLQAGVRRIAQKVGEEGVELALAAAAGDRDEVVNEAADLVYHLLVLLNARDVALTDVVAALEARHAEHP
jgi:phosphoribosyl-ATP pyrophosphohydrolase/phosphoribosyl-AMP cyclohydrolase